MRITKRLRVAALLLANLGALSFLGLALLAGSARRDRGSPVIRTCNNIRRLAYAVDDFHEEHGRYPSSLEELRGALSQEEADAMVFSSFNDAWGHPLRYVPVAPRINRGRFDLYSLGANGVDEYGKNDFGDDIHIFEDYGTGYGRSAKPRAVPEQKK